MWSDFRCPVLVLLDWKYPSSEEGQSIGQPVLESNSLTEHVLYDVLCLQRTWQFGVLGVLMTGVSFLSENPPARPEDISCQSLSGDFSPNDCPYCPIPSVATGMTLSLLRVEWVSLGFGTYFIVAMLERFSPEEDRIFLSWCGLGSPEANKSCFVQELSMSI